MTPFFNHIAGLAARDPLAGRERAGVLTCYVGLAACTALFCIKLFAGLIAGSVAIIADSVHSLADLGGTLISVFSFRISGKPADAEHPFGHGRAEYIATIIVAFLICFMAFELFMASFDKIFHPTEIALGPLSISLMIAAIIGSACLGWFYHKSSVLIDSKVLAAVSRDSYNDVLVTGATLIALFASLVTHIHLDGYAGVAVSFLLVKSAYDLIRDSASAIMGEPVTGERAAEIKRKVESYEGIIGTHDLIVHSYGNNLRMATIHAEVPADSDIVAAHKLIDKIEDDVRRELGISLLIHTDPVDYGDEKIIALRDIVLAAIKSDRRLSAHDFRLVPGDARTNFIFDLVVPHGYKAKEKSEILRLIDESAKRFCADCNCVVNVESGFVAEIAGKMGAADKSREPGANDER